MRTTQKRIAKKHPAGLKKLGLTEMWERMSFYTMMALLVMYMTKQLGFDPGVASVIYGFYIALVYTAPLAFGSLANHPLVQRPFGQRVASIRESLFELLPPSFAKNTWLVASLKIGLNGLCFFLALTQQGIISATRKVATMTTKLLKKPEVMERILRKGLTPFELAFAGGIIMMLGHFVLGAHGKLALFLAMAHIIVGTGLFKPNIATLLHGLYAAGSKLQKIGFNIFYMFVNIGALIAPLVGGQAKVWWGYHAGFATAAVGMFLGLIWFWRSRHDILHANTPSSISAITGVEIDDERFHDHEEKETPESKWQMNVRIRASFALSLVLILFCMSFHQNGSTMAMWASDNTVRAWLKSSVPGNARATVVSYQPVKAKNGGKPNKAILVLSQIPHGTEKESSIAILNSNGYLDLAEVKDAPLGTSLTVTPPFHTAPQPGSIVYESSAYWEITEIYQAAINPVFIIIITLLIIYNRRVARWYKGISLPSTIMLGMLLSVLGSWAMALAGHAGGDTGRVSSGWLVIGYFITTCSEMFVQPVSLALVAKLAPRRLTSTMIGAMYLCMAVGNTLAGGYGGLWQLWSHSNFFWFLGATSALGIPFIYSQRKLLLEALSYLPKEMEDSDELEVPEEVTTTTTGLATQNTT
jgi:POT family proton-dependent oligopeptide transporter